MNILDRTIGFFSPEAAFQRETARKKLGLLRTYEAAGKGRRLGSWGLGSSNTRENLDQKALRDRARFLAKNNPYAASALRAMTSYVIGQGIRPHSDSKEIDAVLKSWADSADCDFFGENNLYGLQALAFRHLMVDGEVFIQRLIDKTSPIPLKLRIIESDRLDENKTFKTTIQGIEYNDKFQVSAYYFFDSDSFGRLPKSKRIPASEIIHLYRRDSVSQSRGTSWFAPVILRLKDFDEFEDSELLRQKIAACFVGFYRDLEPMGEDPFANQDGSPKELMPGTIMSAPSGQTIEFNNPPQPVTYASYAEHTKLTLAAGLGVPYMILSADYSRANYSSSRMAMLNFHRYVKTIQENVILPRLKTIEQWLLETTYLMGAPEVPLPLVWAVPPREFVDPLKDVEAAIESVRAGFRSHSDVLRELGNDPDDVYLEIKKDNETLKKIGINLFNHERDDDEFRKPKINP